VGSEPGTAVGLAAADGLAVGEAAEDVGVGEGVAVPPLHATATTMIANSVPELRTRAL
jgi:hypothetical protein